MLHDLRITAHAACAIAAFVLGLGMVWRMPERVTGVFRAFLSTLWLMVLFVLRVVQPRFWPRRWSAEEASACTVRVRFTLR